jgi:GT2 family glycosyltransferase
VSADADLSKRPITSDLDGSRNRLIVCVQSFNRKDLLLEAIESLNHALHGFPNICHITVFDAGSTDGSREWLAEQQANPGRLPIRVVSAEQPTSFAEGVNRIVHDAWVELGDDGLVLLFETDNTLSDSRALAAAINTLQAHPDVDAVGFTVIRHDRTPAGCGERFPTLLDFVIGQQLAFLRQGLMSRWRSEKATPPYTATQIDVAYTSPLLVRLSAWNRVRGFDAREFPFSDCDVDLCWRLSKSGGRVMVISTDEVVHDNRGAPSAWSATRTYRFHQSRMKLLRQHRGPLANAIIPLLFIRHVVEGIALLPLVISGRRSLGAMKTRLILAQRCWLGYQ